MCVKEWKRIADREAMRYRDSKAFQKGVEDAAGVLSARYRESCRWTLAVECVLKYLDRTDAEKARFFRVWYGIDGQRRRPDRKGMIALSLEWNVATSTLYVWRKELRTLLVIAAAQTGALRPFRMDPPS